MYICTCRSKRSSSCFERAVKNGTPRIGFCFCFERKRLRARIDDVRSRGQHAVVGTMFYFLYSEYIILYTYIHVFKYFRGKK